MEIRELSPGYHHPKMPFKKNILLAIFVLVELAARIGIFVTAIGVIGSALIWPAPAGLFYYGPKIFLYFMGFYGAAKLAKYLCEKVAGPYRAIKITELGKARENAT
jgi:hypothetical protein